MSIVKELCGSQIFVDHIAQLNQIKRSTPLVPGQLILIDCLTDDDDLNTDRYQSVYRDKNHYFDQEKGDSDQDEDELDEPSIDKVRIIFRRPYTTIRDVNFARKHGHNHRLDENLGRNN